jgi:hypothetical protein
MFLLTFLLDVFVRPGLQLDGGPEPEGGGATHACCQQLHAALLIR